MKRVEYKKFTDEEHGVWKKLFTQLNNDRKTRIDPIFAEGVSVLEIDDSRIPDIDFVNKRLHHATGFEGVPVEGLEEVGSFFRMLVNRKFPIGNFIRDASDISYTPAPDVFHDLYGHLPLLANKAYADFCSELGKRALKFEKKPELLRQWERLFWFAIEFSLVKSPQGPKIFGAGIASSHGECDYALSDKPKVLPFDIESIRLREYKIDEFQSVIFILESPQQLYSCLDAFEKGCQ